MTSNNILKNSKYYSDKDSRISNKNISVIFVKNLNSLGLLES